MSNIFKQFHDYQSRNVDNPEYKPLGQSILEKTPTREEIRKEKRRKLHADYYQKHREELLPKMRARYYEYKKTEAYKGVLERRKQKRRVDPNKLTALQQVVFNYLEQQYKETGQIPRAPQIAKHFQKTDASIYTILNTLVRKGKLVRGGMGRLMINAVLSQPEPQPQPEMVYVEEDKYDDVIDENTNLRNENLELKKKVEELEGVALKRYRKHNDGEDYSPGYVGQLKASIKTGQKIINGMREEIESLNKKLEDKELELQNSGSKDDEYKSNLISRLENQNAEMKVEIEELKSAIKTLSKYIN